MSDISTPHAHGMGLWAALLNENILTRPTPRGCFGLGQPTENGGARCLASNEATSRLACSYRRRPWVLTTVSSVHFQPRPTSTSYILNSLLNGELE
jgi:hypothetical protein